MSESTRDVIVVGAGLGGLACAVELARHGLDVLVLEQHGEPGGYARVFQRDGYSFDASLHHLGGLDSGGSTRGLLEHLGIYSKLDLYRRATLLRSELPDLSVTLPNGGLEVTRALQELFPAERQGIGALLRLLKRLEDELLAPPGARAPEERQLATAADEKTFGELLAAHVRDPRLTALLGQLWHFVGLPPSQASAGFSACVFCSSFLDGAYHIRGGGRALARAFVERLEELGGECRVGAKVERIVARDGTVRGVVVDGGESLSARTVIANASPHTTFFELVPPDQISKVYKFRLQRMESSLSAYSLHLGLDCPASEVGVEQDNFFFNYTDDLNEAYRRALSHAIDETDWCLTSYERSDPKTAPGEGCTLSAFELTPARDWLELGQEASRERSRHVRDRLFAKVARRFPAIAAHVAVMELATPRTMARITSSQDGAIFGLAQTVAQSNRRRLGNRSPIEGLWLAGAWTWSGGGYEGAMMSGVQTATAVLGAAAPRRVTPPSREAASGFYRVGARVYGHDVGLYEAVTVRCLLGMMDRGRVEAIEKLCDAAGADSWINDYTVNVYRLDARFPGTARVGDDLSIETFISPRSSHRAAFDHRIVHATSGDVVAEATVEVSFVGKDGDLAPVPREVTSAASQDPTPLVPPTRRFTPRKLIPADVTRHAYRVYFEDTDLQAIAYHVTYVRFCERALLDRLGAAVPPGTLASWLEVNRLAVTGLTIRFLNSSKLGDVLEVRGHLRPDAEANHALVEHQVVLGDAPDTVTADVLLEVAFSTPDGAPLPPPPALTPETRPA